MRDGLKNKAFAVYKHTNMINGKVYIGITSNKPEKRWGSNGINYKTNKHFYAAIKKYKWENFKHEIIFQNLTKEEACLSEIELIKQYKSNNPKFGYNKSTGGDLSSLGTVRIQTPEVRKKISDKNSRAIICINNLIKYKSAREAGRDLNLDYKYISRVLNGHAKHCHGYVFVFEKDFDANKNYDLCVNKKAILCVEKNEVFESISECARVMNLNKGAISRVLKGKRKTHNNLHFKYYLGDKNEVSN